METINNNQSDMLGLSRHVRTQKSAVDEPSGPSPDTESASALILDLLACRTVKNKC